MIEDSIHEALTRAWGMEGTRPHGLKARLWAFWDEKCPRCLRGSLFRRGLQMNHYCPVCCLRFEREEGYFTGAVLIAQIVSMVTLAFIILVLCLLVRGTLNHLMALAFLIYLPWLPGIHRISKSFWIHVDRILDP